ncbi:MAG TPA: LptF/LptG family permease [Alphaproteobacteria bacterium]|jgi:lipopolysaccharide export LptBFGC system permease protein LptF
MVLAQYYLLKKCLKALLLATPGFCLPMLLAHAGPLYDAYSRELVGFFELLYMMLLWLPMIAYLSMPGVVAIAIGFTYFTALTDRELVVMQASRLSVWQLVLPGMIASGVAAAVCAAMSLYTLPEAMREFAERIYVAEKNIRPASLRENAFSQLSPGAEVYIGARISHDTVRNVIVRIQDPEGARVITAQTATFMRAEGRVYVVFENGFITGAPDAKSNPVGAGATHFAQYSHEIARVYTQKDVSQRIWGFFERHIQHLLFPPPAVTGAERSAWLIEGLKRLIHPLLSLAYALLALAIVFSIGAHLRQGVLKIVGSGALVFGGLHTGYLVVMGLLSREPDFPHRVTLLFPVAVALLAAAHLCLLDRERAPRARLRPASHFQAAG